MTSTCVKWCSNASPRTLELAIIIERAKELKSLVERYRNLGLRISTEDEDMAPDVSFENAECHAPGAEEEPRQGAEESQSNSGSPHSLNQDGSECPESEANEVTKTECFRQQS